MLLETLMSLFSLCCSARNKDYNRGVGTSFKNCNDNTNSSNGARLDKDGFLWYQDIGKYGSGEFSMAVVQANHVLEDQCQIESGQFGTFVGVYDGHGGPEAACFVCDHLFRHFRGSFLSHPFSFFFAPSFWVFLDGVKVVIFMDFDSKNSVSLTCDSKALVFRGCSFLAVFDHLFS